MGDPNGVGPEICIPALLNTQVREKTQSIIIGSPEVLEKANVQFGFNQTIQQISDLEDEIQPNAIPVLDTDVPFTSELKVGQVCTEAGKASISYVKEAANLLLKGKAHAMATAPICKESIEPDIPGFQGHTEFIGEMCGDPNPVLTLIHGDWVASHVSTHVSLREAIDRITPERLTKVIELQHDFLKNYKGISSPRIGVAGLNPHAGENGLFGKEEIEIINPTIQKLKSKGYNLNGALPADVVFPQLKAGIFDGVVAMYHDQGHVVTKTLAFDLGKERKLNGVNTTLGLPLIRTSVDHGTGFDISWQGKASPDSLVDAILTAAKMKVKV